MPTAYEIQRDQFVSQLQGHVSPILDNELDQFVSHLQGRVVIITGGASGIGKATALRMAKHGASIVLGDMNAELAEATKNEIAAAGGTVLALKCDVTSWDEQLALFKTTLKRFGTVDVVVPCAGTGESVPNIIGESTPADGDPSPPNLQTLSVNLTGTIYTAHLALHYMKQTQHVTPDFAKSLVLIASMAAINPSTLMPLYDASKMGVVGICRALYGWYAQLGIKVVTVLPVFVETPMTTGSLRMYRDIPEMWAPIDRVSGVITLAASDTDVAGTAGSMYMIPDSKTALRVVLDPGLEIARTLNERFEAWCCPQLGRGTAQSRA